MPSFLGRYLGITFRTEILIMNLVGLVNSTLDWSPLKWTNELKQIWNLSLSQRTLILDTIGEDTIKTVLSWVVITRIVIAHIYTLTYVTNIYPIFTWSRPNLLLPWLILSFFKNVVLEVIVIVIGLLLWYDRRFSIPIFLEFILVKLVPLILASYNWYSNSCLFLHLRHMEKMRTLRRAMRSDSNFITSRLCAKLEDSKYRTRSLTTLLSCESYETYDTHDTISRILEDVNLTPVQKTMRVLRLTDEDIAEARARIKKRVAHKKLTEKSDECFEENDGMDLTLYYSMNSDYERETSSMLRTKDEVFGGDSISSEAVPSRMKSPSTGYPENVEEMRLGGKKKEGTDQLDPNRMKQMKLGPSSDQDDTQPSSQISRRKDTPRFCCGRRSRRSVEKSCSPVKLQALFNCDCLSTDYSFREAQDCCVMIDATLRTSTPRVKPNNEISVVDTDASPNSLQSKIARPYIYTCSVSNVTTDFARSGCTLMETLLKNNLEILKSVKKKDRSAERSLLAGDKLARDLELLRPEENERLTCGDPSRHRDARADAQDLADFVKDLTITRNVMVSLESLKIEEGEDDPEEKAEMELLKAVVAVKSSAEDYVSSVEDSNTQLYTPSDAEKDTLKPDLPEYSFGDTNIPRFYKDSMEMFDGCYEKDFDNNPELQCLLHQMEKKKWNLFAGQTNLETLLATAFLKREGQIDEGLQSWSSDASEKTDRFETATSTSSKDTLTTENLASQKVQADEDHRQHSRPKPRSISKPSTLRPTRDAGTETDDVFQQTRSFSSLTKAKKRQYARKRKFFVDKSGSISQTSSGKIPVIKTESSSSVPKDHPRSETTQLHRNISSKSSNRGTQKQGDLARSASEKSVCDCKMQELESKYIPEFRLDKKEVAQRTAARAKIDSFGTVTLSQVARVSEVPNVLSRRKPPVYPKKTKKENPAPPVAKKSAPKAQQDLLESKRSMDKQSYNSKMFKSKNRVQSVEEQEAREMRALKVYNEFTLLKDKKELEARKKLLASRNPVNRVADDPKRYSRSRKANLTRSEKTAPGNAATLGEGCVDKENICVDARTETDSLAASSSSRETKPSGNTAGLRSFHVPNDRHDCSKLLSVNKVTEILLDNFDRLHGSQVMKQNVKKCKVTAEVDNRKQYKRYRKPKALIDEENVSASSSEKLEGAQKGRELDRTPAKEDVRKKYTTPVRSYRFPRVEDRRDATSPEAKDKELLTTIMLKMDQPMVSSWSSSVVPKVDEGNEIQAAFEENTTTQDGIQPLLDTEEREVTRDPGTPDAPSVPPSSPVESPEETEATRIEEDANQRAGASQSDGTGAPRRPDPTHFTRNINVNSLAHGVVLANINAQGKSRQRDILDDRTERLLHDAFSYKSMDSLLDVPPDVLNVEDMLNDNSLESPVDEFVCRSSNDAVDVLTDHLPVVSYQGGSLEQTILTTIRNSQEDSWLEGQSESTCDLCIITIDNDNSAIDPEEGAEETLEALERRHRPGVGELEMNEVLASITETLKNMNIGGLDLSAIGNLTFEIPRDFASDGDAEAQTGALEVDEAEYRVDEVEDRDQGSKKEEELLRFFDDDIFMNIQFPIVIQRSDLVPDVLIISNDDPRPLDATVGRLLRTNMLTVIEKKEEQDGGKEKAEEDGEREKMDEVDMEEVFQRAFDVKMNNVLEIEQLMVAIVPEHLSRVPSDHIVDVDSGVEYLEEEKLSADLRQESVCFVRDSSVNLSKDTVLSSEADSLESHLNSTGNDPSFAREDLNKGPALEGINKTFDVVKDGSLYEDEVFRVSEVKESIGDDEAVVEIINIGESIKIEEVDVEESVEAGDISSKSSVEIEEIKVENSFEADYIKTEIIFKLKDTTTEESIISKEIKTEESIIIEEIKTEESFIYKYMQFNELKYEDEKTGASNLNEGEVSHTIGGVKEDEDWRILNTETKHQEIVGVAPQVSLKVVVVFWFVVFFFYIQYFYHKICSFSQISRSTSTFRPFEVHTVSTSTSVFLEKAELVKKIRDEIVPEDDENDSSEKSIELGEMGATHLTEIHLPENLVSTGVGLSSNIIEFENEDDIDVVTRELEELMMNLNEQPAHNSEISLLSQFDKEASTQRNILDSSTIESQEEGESIPVSLPDSGDSQPQFPLRESQEDGLKSVDNLQEITKKRSSILEELLELNRNGETKTFQFEEDDSSSSKSLLEDDHQRSRESQLNVTGKVEIDEEGPETEEVVRSGEKVETGALVGEGKVESNEEDTPVPTEETSVHEETVSTEGNVEGSRNSAEVTETISRDLYETSLVEIDSFDSTYTRLSETSKNGAYTVDLGDSSMEEFPITSNRSNESI